MKFLFVGAALAAASLAAASPAAAQSYIAVTGGVQTGDFSAVGGTTATLGTIGGRYGWKSKSWYGVEGDLFFGLNNDEVITTPTVTVKVNSAAFLYSVAYIPAGSKVDLIARVGFGHQAADVNTSGTSVTTNDGAAAYGVGVQYKLKNEHAIRADYTYFDIDQVPTNNFTVSYVWGF